MRSANRLINKEVLSKLTWLEDPEKGKSVKCQFVLSSACPCNLLGRDMMQALSIAVVPTQRGVKALRIHDSCVIEGEDVPHYWYSLDLVNTGPGSVTSSLIKTVRKRVPPGTKIMNSDELHCTLFYSMSKGSESRYEEQLSKLSQSQVHITTLYWDDNGNSAAQCVLPSDARKLFRAGGTPHVSISRNRQTIWQDLSKLVLRGRAATDWQSQGNGDSYSPDQDIFSRTLNWTTHGKVATHLDGKDKPRHD